MALSCAPEDQIAAACEAGFMCITSCPIEAVRLYDIREAAGLAAMTPQELIDASVCQICEFGNIARGVEAWLLCQLAGG